MEILIESILEGRKIVHKAYGEGTIINHKRDHIHRITVRFATEEKTFLLLPNYKSFFHFIDPRVEKYVDDVYVLHFQPAPPPPTPKKKTLKRDLNTGYGSRAIDVYDDFCKKFKWDSSKRGLFAPQKPLYAAASTPEGYSVLFLAHNNWTQSKSSHLKNLIVGDLIEETWDYPGYDLYHDDYTRIIFAKRKVFDSFSYVFIGIYRPCNIREEILPNGKKSWIKVFKRISDDYEPTI